MADVVVVEVGNGADRLLVHGIRRHSLNTFSSSLNLFSNQRAASAASEELMNNDGTALVAKSQCRVGWGRRRRDESVGVTFSAFGYGWTVTPYLCGITVLVILSANFACVPALPPASQCSLLLLINFAVYGIFWRAAGNHSGWMVVCSAEWRERAAWRKAFVDVSSISR
jgi:hypothetical protein